MKKLFLFCSLSFSSLLFSQTTNLGGPLAWRTNYPTTQIIPIESMPGFDLNQIQEEDAIDDVLKDKPWRFGYKYNTNFTLENSGTWTVLPNGDRVWNLQIECANALTINLLFENFYLPEGASLYLYDIENTNRVGAYTSRNNREDGLLGTELVHGDRIIVEYYEPLSVINQGNFTISNVIHGYRSIGKIQNDLIKGLNDSGNCNIDVNCPLGDGWEDQIRSVAMIVVSGSGICTGALVNNTCNDGTPYFLTANHCLGGSTGNWAFRFNWESPEGTESCATTANSVNPGPPYDQTANGATVLVSGSQADHALLEIDNMTLTDAENWNCFYAGWDNSDATTVNQATGIHHPSGDLKKICREDNSPFHSTTGGAQVWWINQWEQGVTEPGSSGSPLFDQNKRIIGQLYGGSAACMGLVTNGGYDFYGRLGVSWNLGIGNYLGSTSCGTAVTNDGYDPNAPSMSDDAGVLEIVAPINTYCLEDFQPTIILKNYGINNLTSVNIEYQLDAGPINLFNWSGLILPNETEYVVLPNLTNTVEGSHSLTIFTSIPNGNTDSNTSNDSKIESFTAVLDGSNVLNLSASTTNTSCHNTNDGIISVITNDGTNPYSFDLDGNVQTSNIFDNLSAGSHTILVVDSSGCNGSLTRNIYNPSPISATTSIVNELEGNDGMIILNPSGGTAPFTYSWTGPSGFTASTKDIFNIAAGLYTVTITDSKGCEFILTDIEIFNVLNINKNKLIAFELYPNPTDGIINIVFNHNLSNEFISITVYDISGRKIQSNEFEQNNHFYTIDLSELSSGTYFISIQNENQILTQKVVKE